MNLLKELIILEGRSRYDPMHVQNMQYAIKQRSTYIERLKQEISELEADIVIYKNKYGVYENTDIKPMLEPALAV